MTPLLDDEARSRHARRASGAAGDDPRPLARVHAPRQGGGHVLAAAVRRLLRLPALGGRPGRPADRRLRVHAARLVGRGALAARDRLGDEQRRRGRADDAVRDRRRDRPRVPGHRHQRSDRPADDDHRRRARARRSDRTCPADVEGPLPARPDRALPRLASGRRTALRPVAAHARAPRRRAADGGAALADDRRQPRGVAAVDGDGLPRGRRLRRAGRARPGPLQGRQGIYVEPNVWMRHAV